MLSFFLFLSVKSAMRKVKKEMYRKKREEEGKITKDKYLVSRKKERKTIFFYSLYITCPSSFAPVRSPRPGL